MSVLAPAPLTIVSGFWQVENKHGDKIPGWLKNSVKINCPYVIFGTAESLSLIKEHRRNLPTHYVELEIPDFYLFRYKDCIEPHPVHSPSKELNMIWNEKMFLMQRAKQLNIFGSEYYAWVDIGVCIYREWEPPPDAFPNVHKLFALPRDKFLFTSSEVPVFEPDRIGSYYHFVSGTFVMHKDFIDRFVEIFKVYLAKYMPRKSWTHTDQVLYTLVYNDRPNLFYQIGHGYGGLLLILG
jgi:hypothetical protein